MMVAATKYVNKFIKITVKYEAAGSHQRVIVDIFIWNITSCNFALFYGFGKLYSKISLQLHISVRTPDGKEVT